MEKLFSPAVASEVGVIAVIITAVIIICTIVAAETRLLLHRPVERPNIPADAIAHVEAYYRVKFIEFRDAWYALPDMHPELATAWRKFWNVRAAQLRARNILNRDDFNQRHHIMPAYLTPFFGASYKPLPTTLEQSP